MKISGDMGWFLLALVFVSRSNAENDEIHDPIACPYEKAPKLIQFGECVGDVILERESVEMQLAKPVKLYTREFSTMYISQNGFVSFVQNFKKKPPLSLMEMRKRSSPFIAPYWCDTSLKQDGQVYYRQATTGPEVFTISEQVKNSLDLEKFSAELVVVITWYNLPPKPRPQTGQVLEERNTFQLVLASDGPRMVGVFLYQELQWHSAFSGEPYPVVGSYDGTNMDYLLAPQSFTNNTTEMVKITNVLFNENQEMHPHNGVWLQEFYLGSVGLLEKGKYILKCLQTDQCCTNEGFLYERSYQCDKYNVQRYEEDRVSKSKKKIDDRECKPGYHFNMNQSVCRCDRVAKAGCRKDDANEKDVKKTEL